MQQNRFSKLKTQHLKSYPSGQFQLFSKLKSNKLNQSNKRNKISIEEQFYNNGKYDDSSRCQLQNQDSWRMSYGSYSGDGQFQARFTIDQEKQLEMLKLEKICYVVEKSLRCGKPVKQIMQQDVISQLQFQIWQIFVTGKRKTEVNSLQSQDISCNGFDNRIKNILKKYRTNLAKKYKSTQEPLYCQEYQSQENYLQKQNKLEQTSEYYEPKILNKQITSPQLKQLASNKNKNTKNHIFSATQSTIKHLQSPEFNSRKFNDIKSKSKEAINQNKKQDVEVVEFTLGHAEESDQDSVPDDQNYTEREQKQIYSNHGTPRSQSFISQQLQNEIENEKYKLTFNRKRKLPKGKAIKNKVMGNLSNEQMQYQIIRSEVN